MKNKTPETKIPVMFQNLKSYKSADERFTQIKVWLMHTGVNHNYSSFSKEAVNKAIPTLANTPILAFIEENDDDNLDYSDHRMVLELNSDDEIKMRYLGSAIGVIPEDNNAKWETRLSDDGEELSYLTIEALLWNKWDDPVDILRERGVVSQSMELSDSFTGYWDEEGVFHFESFEFFGACLLGEGVMPAMKNSTAEIQFSENNSIEKTIEAKLEEFNTLFATKGGEKMTKETERDYEKTQVSHENEEELEDKNKVFEDEGDDSGDDGNDVGEENEGEDSGDNEGETDPEPEPEDGDDNGDGDDEEEPEPEVDTSELESLVNSSDYNSDDYTSESFDAYNDALANANSVLGDAEATQEDVNSALQGLQDAIGGLDEKPEEQPEEPVESDEDTDDDNTSAIAGKPRRRKISEFSLTRNQMFDKFWDSLGEEKIVDEYGDSYSRFWLVDFDESHVFYNDVQDNQQTYRAEYTVDGDDISIHMTEATKVRIEYVPYEGEVKLYSEMSQELEELKAYKRQREESDLKEKFTGQLTDEEFEKVFSTFSESSIEDIEKELFALIGKKNFSLPKSKEVVNKIPLEMSGKDDSSDNPYGALEVYLKK